MEDKALVIPTIDYNGWLKHLVVECEDDTLPKYQAFPVRSGTLYVALERGVVMADMLYHDPGNENGFGGRAFTLEMQNGTTRRIKGPWSSNSGVVNRVLAYNLFALRIIEALFLSCVRDDGTLGFAWGYINAEFLPAGFSPDDDIATPPQFLPELDNLKILNRIPSGAVIAATLDDEKFLVEVND